MTQDPNPNTPNETAEARRLREDASRDRNWKRWGPYLSERQWGTVREDYSAGGESWTDFPHEQAHQRAYRWGEDGLLGVTDRQCRLCFALALWNTRDPILKERLFGLTGPQGNHGEDVKEYYYYLDSTPTHSYMRALYKYPQAEFPYQRLVEENRQRSRLEPEFELLDTGVFEQDRYFDVQVEYAKASPDDLLVRITVTNRGPEQAVLHLLPTLWFRNTWIWGCRHEGCTLKPRLEGTGEGRVSLSHETLGAFRAAFGDSPQGQRPDLLFTENETHSQALFGTPTYTPYVKDAFHRYVIHGEQAAVNPAAVGTKVAAHYTLELNPGASQSVEFRLWDSSLPPVEPFGNAFDAEFRSRKSEADEFAQANIPANASPEQREVVRQALAGLMWTKQHYHYIVQDWLLGDTDVATPPEQRWHGRNHTWDHVYARDVISMPDKWEYPWFAAWDLAFHMIPFCKVDPHFAKKQLLLLLREWYMHPNGQIPAYEFDFGDVNPPVHAWACWRVFQITAEQGEADYQFLAKSFQRLLLNFTWWVNHVDGNGDNVFAGGFLGLDNIGIFDRSKPLPTGGQLEQADGTAWMAFYCGTMLSMALELARKFPEYEEMASKFLDHFVRITDAINTLDGKGLWDEDDGFYYDHLRVDGKLIPLKVRSLVGLLPLIAVEVLDYDLVRQLPEFKGRLEWFLNYRHDLVQHITFCLSDESQHRMLLAIPSRDRLERVLSYVLAEAEFLSPYGIRSLSKFHEEHPYEFHVDHETHTVRYTPGESDSWMFGGNSNWRGPIWFPINFLLIEALEKYHTFYGDSFRIEFPSGSGNRLTLREVSQQLNHRLTQLFVPDNQQHRPCLGGLAGHDEDPHWRDLILFHEYFHAETGEGLGASHQTGWTALVATCIEKLLTPEPDGARPCRASAKPTPPGS